VGTGGTVLAVAVVVDRVSELSSVPPQPTGTIAITTRSQLAFTILGMATTLAVNRSKCPAWRRVAKLTYLARAAKVCKLDEQHRAQIPQARVRRGVARRAVIERMAMEESIDTAV